MPLIPPAELASQLRPAPDARLVSARDQPAGPAAVPGLYLGHKNIISTLSYLTQTQELKEIACERFRLSGARAVGIAEVQP